MEKRHLETLLRRKQFRDLNAAVGGLGLPSKMPGFSYGLDARLCKAGSKLVDVPGSVCYGCYALRGRYVMGDTVRGAQARRLASMAHLGEWAANMGALLGALAPHIPDAERFFRWHDSGDLQSADHLWAIATIAQRHGEWRFWLPTREYRMVREFRARYNVPHNLTIRLSGPTVGEQFRPGPTFAGLPTSTVSAGQGFHCPARSQGNSCLDCRACWDKGVQNVDYSKH